MNICCYNHSEIVYIDSTCPLCDLLTDLASLRSEYESLEHELDIAETALSTCHGQCQHYHSILADIAPEHLL